MLVHHIINPVLVVDPSLYHCLQLKQLFAFCGAVSDCSLVGRNSDYAFIEFSKEEVHTPLKHSSSPRSNTHKDSWQHAVQICQI